MTAPMASDPPWLAEAWLYLGLREFPGPSSNPVLEAMWLKKPGGRWFWEHFGKDDSRLPWCGAFCAHCFQERQMPFPRDYARARAWSDWGNRLDRPCHGCIVTMVNGKQAHVGFVVGETADGRLLVLGGNQNDSVRVSSFRRNDSMQYRWPAGFPPPSFFQLARGDAALSTSQA